MIPLFLKNRRFVPAFDGTENFRPKTALQWGMLHVNSLNRHHSPIKLYNERWYNNGKLRSLIPNMWFWMTPTTRSRDTAHAHCQFWQNGPFTVLSSTTQQWTVLEAYDLAACMVRWMFPQIQSFRFKGGGLGSRDPFRNFGTPLITSERKELSLEISYRHRGRTLPAYGS